MKPREYCCCAIPLVNPGIYATLTEQFVLGVVVGTLSVATPSSEFLDIKDSASVLTLFCSCWSSDSIFCSLALCRCLLCSSRSSSIRLPWRCQSMCPLTLILVYLRGSTGKSHHVPEIRHPSFSTHLCCFRNCSCLDYHIRCPTLDGTVQLRKDVLPFR